MKRYKRHIVVSAIAIIGTVLLGTAWFGGTRVYRVEVPWGLKLDDATAIGYTQSVLRQAGLNPEEMQPVRVYGSAGLESTYGAYFYGDDVIWQWQDWSRPERFFVSIHRNGAVIECTIRTTQKTPGTYPDHDVLAGRRDSAAATHYRRHRDAQSLYAALRHYIQEGMSLQAVESILGPARRPDLEDPIGTLRHMAGENPDDHDDGVEANDVLYEYPAIHSPGVQSSVLLQFRQSRLVNHNPEWFPPDAPSITPDLSL